MKPSEFIHPEDASALRQLESIPGFPTPKFCTNCGSKLPDNARFCTNCGSPLN